MGTIAEECADLASKGPTQAELARTRVQIKAGLLMSLESTGARAEQLARHVLAYGAPWSIARMEAQAEAVSAAAVRDCAGRIFGAPTRVWSEVGPGARGRHAASFARRLKGD
jgi:predicted Zn-dependent peptidase